MLVAALCISIKQKQDLRSAIIEIQDLQKEQTWTTYGIARNPGDEAPDMFAHTMDGREAVVSATASPLPTVVYVFTPQCVWCARNLENLKALISQSAGRYRVVGMSLRREELAAYIKSNTLGIDVFVDPAFVTQQAYSLGGTPMTYVLAPNRTVKAVWHGGYSPEICAEIETVLGVQLPGLTPG
jgi:peroxiredoxin